MKSPAKTTQVSEPNEMQKPHYQKLYDAAGQAFDKTQAAGSTYVGPNQAQLDAVNQIKALSGTLGTGSQEMRDLALSQLRGDWLSPDTNPYIKDVAAAALRPIQERFDANRLAISDMAIAQGAYGGSRQDLQELKALSDFTRDSGDITSSIYGNNYANERMIQQNSGNLLDRANALQLAGPTALMGAGATEQGWAQEARNAEVMAPWAGMSELASVLGSGGFGSSTTTQQKASNPLLGILQGLMGGATTGANLGMGIGGLTAGAGLSAFAPWMLPFAALGGLAGGLG